MPPTLAGASSNFYPRSPCGERPPPYNLMIQHKKFLSTLSLRRATSPHSISCMILTHFYPRSPCGERRPAFFDTAQHIYFYPRSPCGERRDIALYSWGNSDFYPRSPCGERLRAGGRSVSPQLFLSTLSLRRAT